MPYAENAEGDRIYYEVRGDRGPYVVLLMGIGLSSRFWLTVPERLSRHQSQPYRVITIDNRGTGQSTKPLLPWTMAAMAEDVRHVLDAAGVEQATVAGLSMGGMIAQQFVLRYPERALGLILLATTPGFPFGKPPTRYALETLARGFATGMRSREFALLMYPENQLELAKKRIREHGLIEAVKNERLDMRTFLYHALAVATHSTGHALHRVKCPTAILTGAEDVLIPPANSRRMAKRIRHAKLEILPDVGHDMVVLAPDCVAQALALLTAKAAAAAA